MADKTQREFVDALNALGTLVQSIVTISDLNLVPGATSPATITPAGRLRVSTLEDEDATCWTSEPRFLATSIWSE